MSATVIITESKNAAVSVEPYKSGAFGLTLEAKKFFDGDKIETVNTVLTRAELTAVRDALNTLLGS